VLGQFDRCGLPHHTRTPEALALRNALDVVCGSLRFAEKVAVQARQIETLASVHRMLRTQAPPPSDPRQMALF
jgi:hypothetical protein